MQVQGLSMGTALLFLWPRQQTWVGEWSRHGRFNPGKETRYPFYRRLSGPQGRSGRVRNISPPPEFNPWTVQPVVSRYKVDAIAAHKYDMRFSNYDAGKKLFNSQQSQTSSAPTSCSFNVI